MKCFFLVISFSIISGLFYQAYSQSNEPVAAEDTVLTPWTPLIVNENGDQLIIECWGRKYVFAEGNLLPVQIYSQTDSLLTAPFYLNMSTGSSLPVKWGKVSLKLENKSPTVVNISTEALSLNVRGIKVKCLFKIEYDGLVQINFQVVNAEKIELKSISMDISFLKEAAQLSNKINNVLHTNQTLEWNNGFFNEGKGIIGNSEFVPYLWIGNNNTGLFWFCETPSNWFSWQNNKAIQAIRTSDEKANVMIRFNFNFEDTIITDNWNFNFGIQATPVKPLPKKWREWKLDPAPNSNIVIVWPRPDSTSLKYFGYPEAKDSKFFSKRVEDYHLNGKKVLPYSSLTYFSTGAPEWDKRWGTGISDNTSKDVLSFKAPIARVNPLSESFRKLIIKKNKQFFDDYKLDGFYHDNSHLFNLNKYYNIIKDKYSDSKLPYYPILALRSLYQQLYAVIKKSNPEAILIAHASASIVPPILAYEDAYVSGEQFRFYSDHKGKVTNSYSDIITLDQFRTEFSGKKYGLVSIFLPQFQGSNIKKTEPTKNLIGLILLHDIVCWPLSSNLEEWGKVYKILENYNFQEAEFIPYYDKTPLFKSSSLKNVYMSFYKLSPGRTLAFMTNLSTTPTKGSIEFNPTHLGSKNFTVKSIPEEKIIGDNTNKVFVSLDRLDYKFLLIESTD